MESLNPQLRRAHSFHKDLELIVYGSIELKTLLYCKIMASSEVQTSLSASVTQGSVKQLTDSFQLSSIGSPPKITTVGQLQGFSAQRRLFQEDLKHLSNSTTQSWQDLPRDVFALILPLLSSPDIQSLRLVCHYWMYGISSAINHLSPKSLHPEILWKSFPSLQRLDLKPCKLIVRDADLAGLTTLKHSLHHLSLENCENVTDEGLRSLYVFRNLKSLSLKNCLKITDVGMAMLFAGTDVDQDCPKYTKSPWKVSEHHQGRRRSATSMSRRSSKLVSLDVSGCILLTAYTFEMIVDTLPQLRSLCVGGCSRVAAVTDDCLVHIARCRNLTHLDLSGGSALSNSGVTCLEKLSALHILSLWNCLGVSGRHGLKSVFPRVSHSLTELNLRGCQRLEDECLQYVGTLTELRTLDLRACERLSGSGFCHFRGMKKLTWLNLRGCYGFTNIGLQSLAQAAPPLQVLNIQDCWQLTVEGLHYVHPGLASLRDLNVAGCRNLMNEGRSLPGLSSLTKLTALCLKNCERLGDGALEFVAGLPDLQALDISGCRDLTGNALIALATSQSLQTIKLQHCRGLRGPYCLSTLGTGLTSLDLCGCDNILGTSLKYLAYQTRLVSLNLEGCRNVPLLDRGILSLSNLNRLEVLSLAGCTTLTDQGLAALRMLTCLKVLNVSDCTRLTGSGFSHWKMGCALKSLVLQGCTALRDEGVCHLSQCALHLKDLNMKHCKSVGDDSIIALAHNVPGLETLSLQGMPRLTDTGVAALRAMKCLRHLELQFCWQFTEVGLCQLVHCTQLAQLNVMYSWQGVTDVSLTVLVQELKCLASLNILGCHRVSPMARSSIAHLLLQSAL